MGRLLKTMGYSLQSPAKVKERTSHPDRDGHFRYLHGQAQSFVAAGESVISIDSKGKVRHEVARGECARSLEVRPMPVV